MYEDLLTIYLSSIYHLLIAYVFNYFLIKTIRLIMKYVHDLAEHVKLIIVSKLHLRPYFC